MKAFIDQPGSINSRLTKMQKYNMKPKGVCQIFVLEMTHLWTSIIETDLTGIMWKPLHASIALNRF